MTYIWKYSANIIRTTVMMLLCFFLKLKNHGHHLLLLLKKRASPFAFYRTKKNALKTWGWINELLLDNSTKNLNAAIISSKRGLKLGLSADTSERDCWRVLTETAGVSEWSMCVGLLSQPSLSAVCMSLTASTTATELRNRFRYSLCMYINSTSYQPIPAFCSI